LELDAVGWRDTVTFFSARTFSDANGFPSVGARGCFDSHLGCLKLALQSGWKSVLILEDDISFSPHINSVTIKISERLAVPDWDFAYFGYHSSGTIGRLAKSNTKTFTLDAVSQDVREAHFYAVNGRIFDRLIGYLEQVLSRPPGHPLGGPMHVDGAYTMFRSANPDCVTLYAAPKLGWQRPSRSDISPGARDNMPIVKTALSLSRRLRYKLSRSGFLRS
jgi:hypothetical protein